MKNTKKLVIGFALMLALALPITAFAGTTDTAVGNSIRLFCGIDTSKLSDQQKTDMLDSYKKVMDAKKDAVKAMVANKTLTAAEGDAAIKSIDDMIKYHTDNGFTTGQMNGTRGTGFGKGNGGGMMNGKGGMRNGGGCQYNTTTPVVPAVPNN